MDDDDERRYFVTPLCLEIEAALRAAAPEAANVEREVADAAAGRAAK